MHATTSDIFALTDLIRISESGRPQVRLKNLVVLIAVILIGTAALIGIRSLVNQAQSAGIFSAIDDLRDGAIWVSMTKGGELQPSVSNELQNLRDHGFALRRSGIGYGKVESDRVIWDARGKIDSGNRVAIRVKTPSNGKAAQLYRKLRRDKRFIRWGIVGGRAKLKCGPPSGKTLVLCYGF